MKALLVVLAVLILVLVGADFVTASVAESRLAEVAQRRLGLTERPTVDLEGFPFLYHAVRRRFPAATLEVDDVRAAGLAVDRFTLELRDVRFGTTSAIAGGEGMVRARQAAGRVQVGQEALRAYLQRQDVPLSLVLVGPEVRASGTISVGPVEVTATAVGTLAIAEGGLEFRPTRVETGFVDIPLSAVAFRIDLPEVLPGMQYRAVVVERGRAILTFRLDRTALPL